MTDGENRLAAGTLKTDRRGRVRSTVAQRQAVLAHRMDGLESGPGVLKVDLPGGCSVRVQDSGQVSLAAQLIQALAAPC